MVYYVYLIYLYTSYNFIFEIYMSLTVGGQGNYRAGHHYAPVWTRMGQGTSRPGRHRTFGENKFCVKSYTFALHKHHTFPRDWSE